MTILLIAASVICSCDPLTNPDFNGTKDNDIVPQDSGETGSNGHPSRWVSAYLASYMHQVPPGDNLGKMPTEAIDWNAFTHLIYFSQLARADGSLSGIAPGNNMKPAEVREIVSKGHQNNVPVLICIGGWGNYNGFSRAIQDGSRTNFINNIIEVVRQWGFDGVDVNMEPIKSSDSDNYVAFVNELHGRLQQMETPMLSKPLMTAAVHWEPDLIARVQDKFDQINIMTYNLSGAWTGWVTWHNSPLHNDNYRFPGYETTLPSVNKDIDSYTSAGIQSQKLGLGIDFYGYVWTGVSRPKEKWDKNNPPRVEAEVPYYEIMDRYYRSDYYQWDKSAEAPYLSIETGSREQFVSYDNERSIRTKFELIKERDLGGAIIWELGAGYRSNQPRGERTRLQQAVKESSQLSTEN